MLHIECLISLCRLFDLNSLVQMPYYANYNQVISIISDSKKHQYADFQFIQQDAANYLINDKSKSNFIELQLVNINYTFEKAFEDHKFGIIGSEPQYNEDNVKITSPSFLPFLPFNYKDNGKFDIVEVVEKYAPDVEFAVAQYIPFKGKPHFPKPTFQEDEVIFRKKLKKIIKKVDSVLKEKQRVEVLKQSKKINEIARKLNEFIQKNQLDKELRLVEKVSEYETVASKVKNITDSKPAEYLVPYQGVKQHKFDCMPRVTNSTFAKLPNPISHIQKIKESTALVLYKHDNKIRSNEKNIAQIKLVSEVLPYDFASLPPPTGLALVIYKKADQICASNDKFMELIPYVHQYCPILFSYSRNISPQETTPYILSEILGRKFKEYANPTCVESKEPLVKQIVLPFLTRNNTDINFYSNKDHYSNEGGGGDGFPPQPPGGFAVFLKPYSGKAEYDPVKKHVYTVFIANLGLNVVRQPFFKKLINALYINIYSMDDAHKLLSTVSFDSIYEYYLAYQGNGIGRLIYNISGIDTFLNNSAEVENKEESIVNEDGMREINTPAKKDVANQQTADGSNAINESITYISNYSIEFPEDSDQENKKEIEGGASCCGTAFFSLVNNVYDWIKGGEESVESEFEVPSLDKSGENNEVKHSNGNNSSWSIMGDLLYGLRAGSDKCNRSKMPSGKGGYLPPLCNDFKIGNLENTNNDVKNNDVGNNLMKLNLSKVSKVSEDDNKSEASTAVSTPRNMNKIGEGIINAPKKEKTDGANNILPDSKFRKLEAEEVKGTEGVTKAPNKTVIISFDENGGCEIIINNEKWTQKKTSNPEYTADVAKTPEKREGNEDKDLDYLCNAPKKCDNESEISTTGNDYDPLDLDGGASSLQKLLEYSNIDDL